MTEAQLLFIQKHEAFHAIRDIAESKYMDGGKTGAPPGLLQDDCRKLHKWFASRLDARHVIRKNFGDPMTEALRVDATPTGSKATAVAALRRSRKGIT